MRNSIRSPSAAAPLREATADWISIAALRASTALANSATTLSPASPKTLPMWLATLSAMTTRLAWKTRKARSSSSLIRSEKPTASAINMAASFLCEWCSSMPSCAPSTGRDAL
ncbi:hypothetical protein RB623_07975 [Mesorhizobium sp. LHD-90]|uniref:hypothetical protein n=1 Tax=Mesorhizobium sp. LHD-90 TaxID=3071414 RepID=UPI0027E20CC6|nr:hypothetical protein [Mesorhizobium sp. LHD-90]MDQ6433982.1 hypothetical protein [Mesorhizobium sp. LHD-90]